MSILEVWLPPPFAWEQSSENPSLNLRGLDLQVGGSLGTLSTQTRSKKESWGLRSFSKACTSFSPLHCLSKSSRSGPRGQRDCIFMKGLLGDWEQENQALAGACRACLGAGQLGQVQVAQVTAESHPAPPPTLGGVSGPDLCCHSLHWLCRWPRPHCGPIVHGGLGWPAHPGALPWEDTGYHGITKHCFVALTGGTCH